MGLLFISGERDDVEAAFIEDPLIGTVLVCVDQIGYRSCFFRPDLSKGIWLMRRTHQYDPDGLRIERSSQTYSYSFRDLCTPSPHRTYGPAKIDYRKVDQFMLNAMVFRHRSVLVSPHLRSHSMFNHHKCDKSSLDCNKLRRRKTNTFCKLPV